MLSDFHFDLFSAVALKIIFNKAYMFLQEAELPQSAFQPSQQGKKTEELLCRDQI